MDPGIDTRSCGHELPSPRDQWTLNNKDSVAQSWALLNLEWPSVVPKTFFLTCVQRLFNERMIPSIRDRSEDVGARSKTSTSVLLEEILLNVFSRISLATSRNLRRWRRQLRRPSGRPWRAGGCPANSKITSSPGRPSREGPPSLGGTSWPFPSRPHSSLSSSSESPTSSSPSSESSSSASLSRSPPPRRRTRSPSR